MRFKQWTIEDVLKAQRKEISKTVTKVAESRKKIPKSGQKYSGNAKNNIPKVSANALTKHALRVLDLKGYHVWRQNNAGVYDPTKKVFRKGSATPGISDIMGFHRQTARIVACEIKVGKDTLSDDQDKFLERVKRAGGLALVIRTMDDIENLNKTL